MFYVTVVALFGSSSSEALQTVVTSCIQRCFSTSELATSSILLQPLGSTFLVLFQLPAFPGGNGLGNLTGDILSTHCPHTGVFLPDQHFFLNPPLLSLIHTIISEEDISIIWGHPHLRQWGLTLRLHKSPRVLSNFTSAQRHRNSATTRSVSVRIPSCQSNIYIIRRHSIK